MPFGDPRPSRRRPRPLMRKVGRGRKDSTASPQSSDLPSPDPLKVGKMVADALETAPRVMIPLEVRTGARDWHTVLTPLNEVTAAIDVFNAEDGHEYTILVMLKR